MNIASRLLSLLHRHPGAKRSGRALLRCSPLEDRAVPATVLQGDGSTTLLTPFVGSSTADAGGVAPGSPTAGVNLPTTAATSVGSGGLVAVGSDAGAVSQVQVFDAVTRILVVDFRPFGDGSTGGVSVAMGDVTGDGVDDLAVADGAGGGSRVRVFDGTSLVPGGTPAAVGGLLGDFQAFGDGFTGGSSVALGDVDRDGFADLVVGAGGGGGPHVRAFSGRTGEEIASFFAFDPDFRGGVNVATGTLRQDGGTQIVASPGVGGGPRVRVFTSTGVLDGGTLSDFFAFDPAFRGGTSVASGDLTGDGVSELIVGAGPGGGPRVSVFDTLTGVAVQDFFAFESTFSNGVRVGVASLTTIGPASLLVAARSAQTTTGTTAGGTFTNGSTLTNGSATGAGLANPFNNTAFLGGTGTNPTGLGSTGLAGTNFITGLSPDNFSGIGPFGFSNTSTTGADIGSTTAQSGTNAFVGNNFVNTATGSNFFSNPTGAGAGQIGFSNTGFTGSGVGTTTTGGATLSGRPTNGTLTGTTGAGGLGNFFVFNQTIVVLS